MLQLLYPILGPTGCEAKATKGVAPCRSLGRHARPTFFCGCASVVGAAQQTRRACEGALVRGAAYLNSVQGLAYAVCKHRPHSLACTFDLIYINLKTVGVLRLGRGPNDRGSVHSAASPSCCNPRLSTTSRIDCASAPDPYFFLKVS